MTVVLAGCGEKEEESISPFPSSTPDDFAMTLEHVEGSVPPPFHYEWTVEFEADGTGSATYLPDYPGEGAPRYETSFKVDQRTRDDLYKSLLSRGTLINLMEPDDAPVGGPSDTATITVDSATYDVPVFDERGDPALGYLTPRIQSLVPAEGWDRFERQRDRYAKREYGEKPR